MLFSSIVTVLKKIFFIFSLINKELSVFLYFFEKKVVQSIAGIKKVRTFAPAIENDTVAKQEVL